MKYINVVNPTVLKELKKNNINVSNFKVTNGEYVDIRKFVKEFTSFQIKEESMYRHSSKTNGNDIIIDSLENEDMKRFLITYEFSKTLLKSTKKENTGLNEFFESFFAKQFATNLLLPDKLRDKLIKQIIHEENFDNKAITNSMKEIIIVKLAKKVVLPIWLVIDKVRRYQF